VQNKKYRTPTAGFQAWLRLQRRFRRRKTRGAARNCASPVIEFISLILLLFLRRANHACFYACI
jgi:hypothetical protein